MLKNFNDPKTYYNKLLSLGIDPELLKEANLEEKDYATLYEKFHLHQLLTNFKIHWPWQLEILAGRLPLSSLPKILSYIDNLDIGIAHCAAWSGDTKTLDWVKQYQHHLLKGQTDCELTIIHYAALSNNPTQLNNALFLNHTKQFKILPSRDVLLEDDSKKMILNTLLTALDNNFMLEVVEFPPDTDKTIKSAITDKLLRNKRIGSACREIKILIQGWHQQNDRSITVAKTYLSQLPENIIYEIFKQNLPEGISENQTRIIFNKIVNNLKPERLLKQRQDRILELIDKNINGLKEEALINKLSLTIGLLDKNSIGILRDLREKIDKDIRTKADLKNPIIAAYQNQSYKLVTKKIFTDFFKAAGIQKDELTTKPVSPHNKF